MNQKQIAPRSVLIPPGAFIMGTDIEPFYGTALMSSANAKLDEAPIHVRFLAAYRIERYPVTNAEYAIFVKETNHPPPQHWKNRSYPGDTANLPVVQISWHDSKAYGEWAGKRLPTEAEWEKACRGTDGRIYPWGNTFELPNEAALSQILTTHLTAIGNRPATESPYGIQEGAGNVWEWTADGYAPYPGTKQRVSRKSVNAGHKTLRGGSWLEARDGTAKRYFRCANRLHAPPDYTADNIGFRCVQTPPPGQQYPVHIPIEPLENYVKQQKRRNLKLIYKRTQRSSLKDGMLASGLIGSGIYAFITFPKLALGGFAVGIIGTGFLFSAATNFWRRWRAGKRLKEFNGYSKTRRDENLDSE